jgi:GNAT superfamily N-acetyltransferase
MVLVRNVVPHDWETLRDIRLAALRDAPDAFGSTYAEQVEFTKEDWLNRIARSTTFLAYVGEAATQPVGIAGGYQEHPGVVELISMWVDPRARGRGVGEALITQVTDWARTQDEAATLHLWVTEINKAARRLYERCGFMPTGERQQLPSNPALTEIAMARPL